MNAPLSRSETTSQEAPIPAGSINHNASTEKPGEAQSTAGANHNTNAPVAALSGHSDSPTIRCYCEDEFDVIGCPVHDPETGIKATERNWFAAFLLTREGFRPMRCHCGAPMYGSQGVVPIWKCFNCEREVPRV